MPMSCMQKIWWSAYKLEAAAVPCTGYMLASHLQASKRSWSGELATGTVRQLG